VEWSRDGLKAVLSLDGTAQAMFDFWRAVRVCRMDFPNFLRGGVGIAAEVQHAWVGGGAAGV